MVDPNPYASSSVQGEVMPPARSSMVANLVSVIGLLLAGVYLANPGWGVLELLPDNLPGIGNIDEVVATTIFLTCLGRLGINVMPRGPHRTDRKE